MDTAVYLFLAEKGYISGRVAPIVVDGIQSTEAYINPVPSGLVLTGIVVSVSVSESHRKIMLIPFPISLSAIHCPKAQENVP